MKNKGINQEMSMRNFIIEDLSISKSMDVSKRGRGEGAWRICFESDNSYEPE